MKMVELKKRIESLEAKARKSKPIIFIIRRTIVGEGGKVERVEKKSVTIGKG